MTFTKLVPVIYVADLHAEVEFYRELGFTVLHRGEELPGFVAMRQGEVEFGIESSDRFRARAANDSILWQFQVDDLGAVVRLCRRLGYRHSAPERTWEPTEGWQMSVVSPNGYRVSLEGDAPSPEPAGAGLPLIARPGGRSPDFSRGLLSAVVQDAADDQVLMVAHMDSDAYQATLVTGRATFWSRSRERLWEKGETSGNTLRVVEVRVDCDGDAVLLRVEPAGPACHTGARSCFDLPAEPGRGEPEPGGR